MIDLSPFHAALLDDRRRPWPVPEQPWLIRMEWERLLFAHWPVEPRVLGRLLPPGLPLDLWDGMGWVGVVPFRMRRTAPASLPAVGTISTFPELNVRTYVTRDGKPGIWFFSLDARSAVAVAGGRHLFHLPYVRAEMTIDQRGDETIFRSRRRDPNVPGARFHARYRPTGPVTQSLRGTIDAWLTDRFCLYSADWDGTLFRAEIAHAAWPLQPAGGDVDARELTAAAGITLPDRDPILHYAPRLDVVAWWPERID